MDKVKPEVWQFDCSGDKTRWKYGDYVYEVAEQKFYEKGKQIQELKNVPKGIRVSLQKAAKDHINEILKCNTVPIGDKVDIDKEFEQGGTMMVPDMSKCGYFGSGGAATCVIVFAVGRKNGKALAVGAHLDDVQVYPDTMAKDFLKPLLGVTNIDLYVFGGEVGKVTTLSGSFSMDYTEYYSFLRALKMKSNGKFIACNFPSNDGMSSISAAIRLKYNQIEVKLWQD